ncbi:hypothetical protein ACQP1O_29060 [Nocardia sp. CA-151230]|uniref:hypothetical protein n=1 Tax=Nocardia sp. CA-151230 TaxID=3239982 RepID=UPI003D8A1B84
MMSSAPLYLWALEIIGLVAIVLVTARTLRSSAIEVGIDRVVAQRISIVFTAGWMVWTATVVVLAAGNVLRLDHGTVKPWLGVAIVAPIVVLLASSRLPLIRRALSHPGIVVTLVRPQEARFIGIVFLTALALGELPAVFALPAGIGDMAIGLAASWLIRSPHAGGRTRNIFLLNVFGLIDFLYAFAVGFLGGPGRTQLLHLTPSTQSVSMLPLVLIPTTGVPVLFVFHVISLTKLRVKVPVEAVPV